MENIFILVHHYYDGEDVSCFETHDDAQKAAANIMVESLSFRGNLKYREELADMLRNKKYEDAADKWGEMTGGEEYFEFLDRLVQSNILAPNNLSIKKSTDEYGRE